LDANPTGLPAIKAPFNYLLNDLSIFSQKAPDSGE
jgi:hypothetical protein